MSRETNRWMILAASIICNMNIGAAYAWSVFQKPLVNMFHWTPSEASLTFTFSLAIMPVAMIIAGKIQDQKGPRTVMMVGGILFGAGIFGSGFAESLNFLYACGFLNGLGIGTVYACAVANTVKWFPDRKGFASGLIAAGLGSGAVVFAPIASYLIQTYDVMVAFKVLGIVYLVFIVIAASMVKAPPTGYKPLGWNPPVMANVAAPGSINKNWKDMLRDPMFYVLWGMYTVGAIAGLMIIGHAASIGQEVIKLTATSAAVAVSFLGLANTFGRVFWGYVSDRIGRYPALVMIFIVIAAAMVVLPNINTFVPFVLVIMAVGLCFGGILGIFPIVTADLFGLKNLGMNYGVMFSAFAAAAIIGPRLAARVKEVSGDYGQAFMVSAALSIIGAALTLFVKYQLQKRQAAALSAAKAEN